MANKALWQILDTIEDNYEDIDIYELEIDLKSKMGKDYIIGVWDHEDYESNSYHPQCLRSRSQS